VEDETINSNSREKFKSEASATGDQTEPTAQQDDEVKKDSKELPLVPSIKVVSKKMSLGRGLDFRYSPY
jgi:hypothetical protein